MEAPVITEIKKRLYANMRAVADYAMGETPEQREKIKADFVANYQDVLAATDSIAIASDEFQKLEADMMAIGVPKLHAAKVALYEGTPLGEIDQSPEGWLALQVLETVMYAEEERGVRWEDLKESDPVAFRKILIEASGDALNGLITLIGDVADEVAATSGLTADQVSKVTIRTILAIQDRMQAGANP